MGVIEGRGIQFYWLILAFLVIWDLFGRYGLYCYGTFAGRQLFAAICVKQMS